MYSKIKSKIGGFLDKIYTKLKEYKCFHYPVVQVACMAFITTLIIEMFSKSSIFYAIGWMFMHPIYFLVNMCIVAIPYSLGMITRFRYWVYAWVSILWTILAIINFVVMKCRVTPFTAGDIRVLPDVLPIIDYYIPVWLFITLIVVAVLVLIILILEIRKIPKIVIHGKKNYLKNLIYAVATSGLSFGFVILAMNIGLIAIHLPNIRQAYIDYGFAYCFSNTVFNTGVDEPADYGQYQIDDIVNNINKAPLNKVNSVSFADDEDKPNVIFIQLESFFNVNRLEGVEFTTNPIPNLTEMYKNYHTGLLHVPSISAGTANTEFEVLTGMNMDDFGPGEYPFQSIVNKVSTESIAFNLKKLGYATHGIHDNTAAFYGRNRVYPRLGIDVFTSVEYMVGVERNPLNWAKDTIITKYVNQALDSSEGSDFVFAVSVQGHGAYPDEDILENPSLLESIDVDGNVSEYNFAYYLEEISQMDAFVAELTDSLSKRDEKSIVVFYGDHLPGFEFEESDLVEGGGTLFDTEYVIWSNFDMGKRQVVDLEANELSAYVQQLLGYTDGGYVSKLHQRSDAFTEEEYLSYLHDLTYDMLYGDNLCHDGENPYVMSELQYAYNPIVITGAEAIHDAKNSVYYLTVKGENFTEYSTIYLNGKSREETIYVDENTLFCPSLELKEGDYIIVSQSPDSLKKLTKTEDYILDAAIFE